MPDENTYQVLDEVPNVADGQAVVNAVAQDVQNITDAATDETVERIGELLRVQSEEAVTTSAVTLDDSQWDELAAHLKFAATSSMLCTFACMAVFGAVCAGYLVKGWRRG